jgi:anti-anti-sigma factor
MNFEVSTVRGSTTTVLVLTGELDLATVHEFESALVKAEKEAFSIILDLSGLRFLDCSGLHSFVAAAQRIKNAGGELKLIAGPAHVQRLFALTRVDTLFDFVEDRATVL